MSRIGDGPPLCGSPWLYSPKKPPSWLLLPCSRPISSAPHQSSTRGIWVLRLANENPDSSSLSLLGMTEEWKESRRSCFSFHSFHWRSGTPFTTHVRDSSSAILNSSVTT